MNKATTRYAAWAAVATALILALPLIAMSLTDEVVWGWFDFLIAGVLLFNAGFWLLVLVQSSTRFAYRAGVGVALAAVFLLIWMNLAVGLIGSESDRANLMFIPVVATILTGAIVSRFKPGTMSTVLVIAALLHVLITLIAIAASLGSPSSGPFELIGVNAIFVALFSGSALLLRYAALDQGRARTQNSM